MTVMRSAFASIFVLASVACSPSQLTQSMPAAPSVLDVESGAKAHPNLWPAAASPRAITSPETEAAIDVLLRDMSLEEKVGQLVQADIGSIKPADLARYPLGSVLAGGNSGPYGDERASAAKWQELVNEFRAASLRTGAKVPIMFGVDAVHGHSNLPGATIFPHNIGLGATRDVELMQRIGRATAVEIAGSGIEWTFAPTLAVPQDVRWGRSYEGYSSEPTLVARYARAMTLGLQGEMEAGQPLSANEVAATAKHFLADGGTADGRDQGDARITEAELIAKHAQGYPAAIDAGALTVMASFSSWNGVKHHGNATLLNDVLKGRMGFSGLVVGDWNGHGQIPGCSAAACPAAINAGLDMFMAPDSWKGVFESTLAAAKSGAIPAARLDDAVRRVLRVKFKLGLMGPVLIQRGDVSQVGSNANLEVAREAVAKSLVLLKNNNNALPIRRGANVLIAGSGADNMAMQAGGWTITWQGTDTTAADFPNGQTIGRAIEDAVKTHGGTAAISVSGQYQSKPDVAVVVIGETPYAEFEGDRPDLAYRTNSNEEALIARLKAQGVRVVVVFLSGRPMFAGKLINQSDAFVAAWLPGTQGRGVADVLVAGADGKARRDFTGRLPFAWPNDARSPISRPLFEVGYGLDYGRETRVASVNEDPRVDMSSGAQALSYVVRGRVPAPWHLEINGSVVPRTIDLTAQEDARQFTWAADGAFAINGPAVDLSPQLRANEALLIDWRIDQAARGPIKVSFGTVTVDLQQAINGQAVGAVLQTAIPLQCFKSAGADLAALSAPFKIEAQRGFVATIRSVRVGASSGTSTCPPQSR
jgi:beta-glucosidase